MIRDIATILPPSPSHMNLLVEVVTALCLHIRNHKLHVNSFLQSLLLFKSLCEKHPTCIIKTMNPLFSSIIEYWKTSLNPILEFVRECQNFSDFSTHHGIILHQLLFILYDDIFSDLNEALIVKLSHTIHF